MERLMAHVDRYANAYGGVYANGELTLSDWSNINAGIAYSSNAVASYLAKALTYSYNGAREVSLIKNTWPLPNVFVSSSALKTTSNLFKAVGNTAGGLGVGLSLYQMSTGRISKLEGTVDLIFGIASFFPGLGTATSLLYFGSKALYEYSTGETLFEKPRGLAY